MLQAKDLLRKIPKELINIKITTLWGIRDYPKKNQIIFECNKNADWTYPTISNLIKAAYLEINKTNPFNPNYKALIGVGLPAANSIQ